MSHFNGKKNNMTNTLITGHFIFLRNV